MLRIKDLEFQREPVLRALTGSVCLTLPIDFLNNRGPNLEGGDFRLAAKHCDRFTYLNRKLQLSQLTMLTYFGIGLATHL